VCVAWDDVFEPLVSFFMEAFKKNWLLYFLGGLILFFLYVFVFS